MKQFFSKLLDIFKGRVRAESVRFVDLLYLGIGLFVIWPIFFAGVWGHLLVAFILVGVPLIRILRGVFL